MGNGAESIKYDDNSNSRVRELFDGYKVYEWISVDERLPEDGTWNLFTDGKSISVERYKADALDHFCPPGRWFQLDDVVAWMPLPEPYKESKTD